VYWDDPSGVDTPWEEARDILNKPTPPNKNQSKVESIGCFAFRPTG